PKKPKKKGKAKGWILGILAVIILAAAALAVFRWNAVSAYAANLTAKTFSSPEEYYQRVEKDNIQRGLDAADAGQGVFAIYREAAETRAKDEGLFLEEKIQLSFNESALSDEILDLIEDELGMDVSWLKNVGFYLSVGAEDERLGGSLTAFLNDKDIIDADYMLDNSSGDVFFTVPRLSGQAIRINQQEMAGASGLDPEEQAAARELMETLTDEKLITTLIDRYSEIVIGDLTKVEKGTQELSAGDLKGNYTALEVKIDGKVMLKIAKDVLKKAQNDAEVEKLIRAVLKARGMSEAEIEQQYDYLLEEMENKRAEFEEMDPKEITESILMTVYVDGQGRIIGRDIMYREDKDLVSEFRYAMVLKGLNYGLHAEFFLDNGWSDYRDEKTVVFDGGGKLSLNKEITGSFDMHYKTHYGPKDDEVKNDMKLCKITLEAAAKDKGFTFDIDATPHKDMLNRLVEKIGTMPNGVEDLLRSLSGSCSGEIKSTGGSVTMTLKSDKKDLLVLGTDTYRVEQFDISRPANAVDPYEWASGLDFSKLQGILQDLMDAGVPASLLGSISDFL
ncbi:MAG: hypothetical protein ACSW8E_03245, partial [Clostridia bacterium]